MLRLNAKLLDNTRTKFNITSDEKLAGKLGMSRNGIHGLRHGKASPSTETLWKLKELTGIPMEEWLIEETT